MTPDGQQLDADQVADLISQGSLSCRVALSVSQIVIDLKKDDEDEDEDDDGSDSE